MTKYQSVNNMRNKNINQPDHGSTNQPIINTVECEKGKKYDTLQCKQEEHKNLPKKTCMVNKKKTNINEHVKGNTDINHAKYETLKQKCQPSLEAMKTKSKINNQGYCAHMQTIQN